MQHFDATQCDPGARYGPARDLVGRVVQLGEWEKRFRRRLGKGTWNRAQRGTYRRYRDRNELYARAEPDNRNRSVRSRQCAHGGLARNRCIQETETGEA